MVTALRGFLLFVPATLAIFGAPEATEARRYSSAAVRHVEHHFGAGAPKVDPPSNGLKIPNAALESVDWEDLDGWAGDDHASAFATFYASCRPIVHASLLRAEAPQIHPVRDRPVRPPPASDARNRPSNGQSDVYTHGRPLRSQSPPPESRPIRAALEQVCARAVRAGRLDQEEARQFFEANFAPVRIRRLGDPAGFLTGYYEPIVDGSRFPTGEFRVPLFRRPRDLVAPGVAAGGPFPNTGRAFRQTPTGELVPYFDRGEIEDGALDGQHLEICWLRSPADALSVQIEGSARVRLEDGTLLRISYDAHNGYPFVPVGRVLIERRLVAPEESSIPRIREWMRDNPDGAKMIRRQSRQVVFFRIVGLNDDTEAVGAQGIPLTAGRSIAVDKALHAYGTPFFIEADLPLTGRPFRRLMIAQDTGAAIVGPARADLFFGAGEEAGQMAGRIQQSGRFAMLVPRELVPSVMSASVPLPPAKPSPVPPAKSKLQQIATRTVNTTLLPRVEPNPAKRERLEVAATRPAELPPSAKPRPSQVTARPLHPAARPLAVRAEVSEVDARALRPAASLVKPGISQVAAGAHQSASNSAAQHARRHSVHSERPRATQKLSVGAPEGRQR